MGLFGPTIKYSQREHQLPEIELKKFLSHIHITPGSSVGDADRDAVLASVMARRGGDGSISLQQIYEVLMQLRNQNKITKIDFQTLMKDFEMYYAEHFKN